MSPKRPASPSTEPDAKRRCSGELQGSAIEATAAVYYVADQDLELLRSGSANEMIRSGSSSDTHNSWPSPAAAIAGSPTHAFASRLTNFDVAMTDASVNTVAVTAASVPPPSTLSAEPSSTPSSSALPSLFTPAPTRFGGTLRPPTFPPPPDFSAYSFPSFDYSRYPRHPLRKRRASEPTMPVPFVDPFLDSEIIRALPPHLRPRVPRLPRPPRLPQHLQPAQPAQHAQPAHPAQPALSAQPAQSAQLAQPAQPADNSEALLAFFSEGREIHVNRLRAKILRLTAENEKLRKRDAEVVALREQARSQLAEMDRYQEEACKLEEEQRKAEEERSKAEEEARTQQKEIEKLKTRNEDLRKEVRALEADLIYTQTITGLKAKWDREAAEARAYEAGEGDDEYESDEDLEDDEYNRINENLQDDDTAADDGSAESEEGESESNPREELQIAHVRIQELEAENVMLREHMHGYDPSHPPQSAPAQRTSVQSDDEDHETEALDPNYAAVLRGAEAQLEVLQIANNGLSQQNHSLVANIQSLRTERDSLAHQAAALQGELDRVRLSHTRAWWENGTLLGNLGVPWEVNSALGANNGQVQAALTNVGQAAHGQEHGFVGFAPLQANPPPPYVPPMLIQELAQLQLLSEAAGPVATGAPAVASGHVAPVPVTGTAIRARPERAIDNGCNVKVESL